MKFTDTLKQALLIGTVTLATAGSILAAEGPTSIARESSNRMSNKLGMYLGVGEPAPTAIGLNVAYNLADFVRLRAGYGKQTVATGVSFSNSGLSLTEASASTFGMGARFFMPGWNLSPTAGIHFASVSYSGDGQMEVGGFKTSGSHVYSTLGLDWQSNSGFNAGLGYQFSLGSGGSGLYLTAGWFFDWLS